MKHTEECPKCGSKDISLIEGYSGSHGTGNNIEIGMTIFNAKWV